MRGGAVPIKVPFDISKKSGLPALGVVNGKSETRQDLRKRTKTRLRDSSEMAFRDFEIE